MPVEIEKKVSSNPYNLKIYQKCKNLSIFIANFHIFLSFF